MINLILLKLDLWRARGELEGVREYIKHNPNADKTTIQEKEYYESLVSRLESQIESYEWHFDGYSALAIVLLCVMVWMFI